MKGISVKKLKLITSVGTLKQAITLHKSNLDRTIFHQRDEILEETDHNKEFLTRPTLEDSDDQELQNSLEELLSEFDEKCVARGEDSIVFYTTSIGGVRKTFEDCRKVRFLLENHKVSFRERDVSMDCEFKEELWKLLGKKVTPPRLFIKSRYIGGAEEVVALNENGKLKRLLEGISSVARSQRCDRCENERFLMCWNCNGRSRVVVDDGMWKRCKECNENGLVKCVFCT
ncbi:hypothetical protein AALP_AA3G127700 [Arabis alpina]|uniref:Glutaredoxin domain-containing protein n=1 Tax=Arabis alpina TaxID=50452 RepID=A0A087H8U1_ARAAL|nr:hypothetical protein AALP_AA3G127700 [Arabis alpina]